MSKFIDMFSGAPIKSTNPMLDPIGSEHGIDRPGKRKFSRFLLHEALQINDRFCNSSKNTNMVSDLTSLSLDEKDALVEIQIHELRINSWKGSANKFAVAGCEYHSIPGRWFLKQDSMNFQQNP
ncbi:unnamed protein product [Adineta ricciae]|uniref:Uncharacterized protein n=1 Tax=Adineta ricciae TaxID=249248 RepID=A0A813M8I1_ADIRI|nr:unnamed protein product [Adineta ricciae]